MAAQATEMIQNKGNRNLKASCAEHQWNRKFSSKAGSALRFSFHIANAYCHSSDSANAHAYRNAVIVRPRIISDRRARLWT